MSHILLVPVVSFEPWHLVGGLELGLKEAFRASVEIQRQPVMAAECANAARGQYDSRCLLRQLAALSHGQWILGLTSVDLFVPVLTFVIGEAMLDGPAALVSTYRLREELYGLPANAPLLAERLQKEAVHELGHCHGLVHCMDSRCVMYGSASVESVDLKSDRFCDSCSAALRGTDARSKTSVNP